LWWLSRKNELFSVTDEKVDQDADLNERPDKRRAEVPNEISNAHEQDGWKGRAHKPSRKHNKEVIHASPLSVVYTVM